MANLTEATLTEIARRLKETFEGYSVPELQDELRKFKEKNNIREAESIRIGDMSYIVINDVYKREEYEGVPDNISPLFYNSINNRYAIIDAKTSSTLIDEVYSRVTYIQRICSTESNADTREMRENLHSLFGAELDQSDVRVEGVQSEEEREYADLFQLHLVLDSGTSAMPDTFGFMWKKGEIKEIPASVMRQVRRSGDVSMLKDRDLLEKNRESIQKAVFDTYSSEDADIENITVKSIFEIRIPVTKIHPQVRDKQFGRIGRFNTVYLAGRNNEFASLNANIHTCNLCRKDLVDVNDPSKINHLHINIDAVLPREKDDALQYYALGCECCLEECPECHSWHFNYEKYLGSKIYDTVTLAPGRSFIKRLTSISGNYCSCRECIDWVYDENTGTENEHDIIPIEKIAFINYANEQIASYKDYKTELKRDLRKVEKGDGKGQSEAAKEAFAKFRRKLAEKFDMDVKDILVTSIDKCRRCIVCNGRYYWGAEGGDYNYRCNVCEEMVSEKRHMVTRNDGIIFMRRHTKRGNIIDKYTVTKLGNLKRLSSHIEQTEIKEEDTAKNKA